MNGPSINNTGAIDVAKSYTDLAALNDVKKLGRNQDPKAIMEVARQFESFFITQLMKEMRAGVDMIGKDNFTNSNEMKFHQQMFDQQMSLEMASKGGYGLAELLARQLTQQFDLHWDDADANNAVKPLQRESIPAPAQQSIPASVQQAKATPKVEETKINKDNFFHVLKDFAKQAAAKLGVDPRVLLAQAALETGWGEFISKDKSGPSNNLFNIKSDSGWQGDSVKVTTVEYRNGLAEKEQANFRSYQTFADSFNDYADFLLANPRYEKALSCAADNQGYLEQLQAAGYATDPKYAEKILQLLDQPEFNSPEIQN